MAEEFQAEVRDVLREFVIDDEVLHVYPSVVDLVRAFVGLQKYIAWVDRTDNGKRMMMEPLIGAKWRMSPRGRTHDLGEDE